MRRLRVSLNGWGAIFASRQGGRWVPLEHELERWVGVHEDAGVAPLVDATQEEARLGRRLVRDDDRSNSAEVSVLTGKVSVSIKKSDNTNDESLTLQKGEIMLYPHQKAIYLVDEHVLKPETPKKEPELQIWKRVNLLFENKPLKDIVPVLNSSYHVRIQVSNERLNHYILNADMEGFNLPDVLEALKKSLNVNYEIKNDIIELE